LTIEEEMAHMRAMFKKNAMVVSIPWLLDHPEAYQDLCKLWASEKFITKSRRARQCRGSGEAILMALMNRFVCLNAW
jgi:hypothetical protein